jgi:beta-lactamase class A
MLTVAMGCAVAVSLSLSGGGPTEATVTGTAATARVVSPALRTGQASSPGRAGAVVAASQVDPFRGILAYLRSRSGVAQVALFDEGTGRMYRLSDGQDTQYTASIVKSDILAMWLRRYQGKPGTIPASIPYSIRYLMTNMITVSDNIAATSLFYFGGGCAALTRFNSLIPTRQTKVGCQTPTYYGWGNSTTTAADQVAIVRDIAYPNHVLAADARDYAVHLMQSVVPAQRWGVSCGPWGTTCEPPNYANPVPGVTVALKNGWKYLPSCTAQDESCPWQVNSIGWVAGQGRNYVLAVLTTDDPAGKGLFGFNYGITTIQAVAQRIWANLAP